MTHALALSAIVRHGNYVSKREAIARSLDDVRTFVDENPYRLSEASAADVAAKLWAGRGEVADYAWTTFRAQPARDALDSMIEWDGFRTIERGELVSTGQYVPDVYFDGADAVLMSSNTRDSLVTGYSGQYSYGGPIMHASEFIGGRLADYMIERMWEGHAFAVVAVTDDTGDDGDDGDRDAIGWAIIEREALA